VAAPTRWTDFALDQQFASVNERIADVAGLPVDVALLTQQLEGVKRELTAEEGAVPRLSRQLAQLIENPHDRRERWKAFAYATIGALVGVAGGGVVLAAFNIHTG
jgi:hypothetical protein